jgi:hypothetical protein
MPLIVPQMSHWRVPIRHKKTTSASLASLT